MQHKEKQNFLNRLDKTNGNIFVISNDENFFFKEIISNYSKYYLVNNKKNRFFINSNFKTEKSELNLKNTSFSNNLFDLIIFYNYFREIGNDELLECSRILKGNGLIYRNILSLENLFKSLDCEKLYKNNKNLFNSIIDHYFINLVETFPNATETKRNEFNLFIDLVEVSKNLSKSKKFLFNKYFRLLNAQYVGSHKKNLKNRILLEVFLKTQGLLKTFLKLKELNNNLELPSCNILNNLERTNLSILGLEDENVININPNYFNQIKLKNRKINHSREILLKKIDLNDYDYSFFKNYNKKSNKLSELLFDDLITNNSNILVNKYLEYISALFENLDEEYLIRHLKNIIINNYQGSLFYKIYCFIQDSIIKHPILNYFGNETLKKPYLILFFGLGKCGNSSLLASYLFTKFGFKCKITQLKSHVICEVFYKGKWRIVDTHFFKFGVYPKNNKDEWASLNDVKKNPLIIDRPPSFNFSILFNKKTNKNITEKDFNGYIDKKDIWSNSFISNYYLKIKNEKLPPKPLDIYFKLEKNYLYLKSKTKTNNAIFLSLFISSKSRGWSYNRLPDRKFIKPLCSNILKYDVNCDKINNGIKIKLKNKYKHIFINTKLKLKNYKDAFYWPQDEIKIINKT